VVNLIPVTLGNIGGGSFFVGAIYWFVYEYKIPPESTASIFAVETEVNGLKAPGSKPKKPQRISR
jgi:hypothetical protein